MQQVCPPMRAIISYIQKEIQTDLWRKPNIKSNTNFRFILTATGGRQRK